MKHIFIVNPNAGKHDSSAEITQIVSAYAAEHPAFEHLIHITQCAGDATQWVCRYCNEHPHEEVRFYACGGDGTLNEVVSGVMTARDHGANTSNCEVSCFAIGSGNDYIKYYGTQADFQDLNRLVAGIPHQVDVMRIGERYGINVTNLGFDAMVGKTANDVRRWPILGKGNSYTTGIVKCLFTSMRNPMKVMVDGEPFFDGMMLLCTIGNGRYNGGKYMCSPLSKNDDGLLEVSLFRTMSVLRLVTLIGDYVKGTHMQRNDIQHLICYRRGTQVSLDSPRPFWLGIDGEMVEGTHFEIVNIHQPLRFVAPK